MLSKSLERLSSGLKINRGADGPAALVISEQQRPEDFDGAWLKVENVRRAMAVAAAEVQHHPSRELQLVGITGTNGKTTTAYLIASIPEAAGELVAMTGTVEYRLGKERRKADRTTPEATDMQRMLRQAVGLGCRTAVMECSSQAMDFHRCDELEYAVAVFSNLTRDQLSRALFPFANEDERRDWDFIPKYRRNGLALAPELRLSVAAVLYPRGSHRRVDPYRRRLEHRRRHDYGHRRLLQV